MTRRTIVLLVTFVLGLLVAPLAAHAQPERTVPRIGVLRPGYASADADPMSTLSAFRQGLRELGYIEGQTIHLEYRFAEWQLDQLPGLAAELVRLTPDAPTTRGVLQVQSGSWLILVIQAR